MPRERRPARHHRPLLLQFVGLALGVIVLAVAAPLSVTVDRLPVWLGLLLCTVQAGALALAPRSPRLAAWVGALVLGPLSWAALPTSGAPWPVSATSIIAFCLTLALASFRVRWAHLVPPALAALVIATVRIYDDGPARPSPGPLIADLVTFAGTVALTLLVAGLVRNWADVRAQLAAQRGISAEEAALRQIAEERTRIARELHDVVAHGLSAIQVQAASARYRLPELGDDAAAEFDDVAATARRAMGEMRSLLTVLRGTEGAENAPQPGLAQVRSLVESAPHAEVISLSLPDSGLDDVPASIQLTAYRMIQEALSNTVRHAPGARVSVRVSVSRALASPGDTLPDDEALPTALTVTVENAAPSGPRRPAPPAGGGHGLVGMRERAALHGGHIEAGPTAAGGFAVTARLPLDGAVDARHGGRGGRASRAPRAPRGQRAPRASRRAKNAGRAAATSQGEAAPEVEAAPQDQVAPHGRAAPIHPPATSATPHTAPTPDHQDNA